MKSYLQLRQFIQHPVNFLNQLRGTSPDLIQEVYLGPKRFIIIFDPTIATSVLVQKADQYLQGQAIFRHIIPLTGVKGLVQLQGQKSRAARKKSRELFSPGNLDRFKLIIEEYTQEALDEITVDTKIEIAKVMTKLVLRTALKIFLGIDAKKEVETIGNEFLKLNQLCGKKMLSPLGLPSFIPTPNNMRIKKLKNSLRKKIQNLIQTSSDELNVVSVFINEESLVDQCMTFLFAGHETTASSLAFSFLLLAQHPEYQLRIAQDEKGLISNIYKESLRLFPPAYMLVREALKDDQLGKLQVKKGDQVIIGLKQIHRLDFFFPNPDQFLPERFDGPVSKAFFPFSKGPKACIGETLAYIEAEIIIKAFCKRLNFKKLHHPIQMKPLITLHPKNQDLYVC